MTMKLRSIDYVTIAAAGLFIAFLLAMILFGGGCVSAPPGSHAGWSFSLVNIQLGGSQTTVDILNNLQGTNITQRHKTPIEADLDGAVTLTPQSLTDNFTPKVTP